MPPTPGNLTERVGATGQWHGLQQSADAVSAPYGNLPCRISFRLASQVDSRTILDQGGAEHLLGNGDMLVSWNSRILRLQGFFLPEEDLRALLSL
jgi:DNA segregation ATPase FtsK/SpoIIIE-like protein